MPPTLGGSVILSVAGHSISRHAGFDSYV